MILIIKQKIIGLAFPVIILFSISSELSSQTDPAKPFPQLLFPGFTRSIIIMKSGKTNSASLNYNTIDEEMVFDQKGVYMVLDKPEEIDTVYLQNLKFIPVEKAFYEVVVNGNISLFIQHKSRYAPVGSNTAYGLTSQTLGPTAVSTVRGGNQVRNLELPDNVKVSPATVYWVRVDNEMHKFTTERQFLKIFPGKENEIKEFFKTSKLDLKSREGLIKLGNYCNEILK
ncbi:MAG: hypothetical protein NT144_05010 [Bacteroidia bacterium]|nr:hypothetical protein [Bacteroidia bacterium]